MTGSEATVDADRGARRRRGGGWRTGRRGHAPRFSAAGGDQTGVMVVGVKCGQRFWTLIVISVVNVPMAIRLGDGRRAGEEQGQSGRGQGETGSGEGRFNAADSFRR